MPQHYSVEKATNFKKGELYNIGELYLQDINRPRSGYPYLRSAGANSDVMVYDATTHQLKRRETPNGEIIEAYENTSH